MTEVKKTTKESTSSSRYRGIYLLPNLLTTAGLFAGFYAVVAAMKGYFGTAGVAIFIAMIADTLDGRVARLTKTESAFGAQYDSLSDVVAFGIAPALVIYSWGLSAIGKLGWLAAFCYAAAGALRLARFNIQESEDKRYFQGLPIPAAAGVIAGIVWTSYDLAYIPSAGISMLLAAITVIVSVLMVSNVNYYSFKELDMRGVVPFSVMVLVVLLFVFISLDPPSVLMLGFMLYAASGPVLWLWCWLKGKRKRS
jgi:CDP-diacylglycerol--serine O-phosphatidyltransferase